MGSEIKALPVLGITRENIGEYSIRLSKNLPGFDPASLLFDRTPQSTEVLNNHLFGYKWPKDAGQGMGRAHTIYGKTVLQFLQLDSSKYVFVGGFHPGEIITVDTREVYEWHGREVEEFRPFVGRLIVRVQRTPGYTGMDFNLGDLKWENFFLGDATAMVVDTIKASPLTARSFPGYANVRLNHAELAAVINDEQWSTALNNVQGIYLQTDMSNGWHYVGSAYSQNGEHTGILSRWREYAYGDHTGGNALLQAIPNAKQHIEQYFHYSILEIFDMQTPKDVIINREHWWMKTLGSLRCGKDLFPHGYNN